MTQSQDPMPRQASMPMPQMPDPMPREKRLPPVVYWHNNQVAVTFFSELNLSEGKQRIIESLRLDRFNTALNEQHYNLTSFDEDDVPHPSSSDEDEEVDEAKENLLQEVIEEGTELLKKGLKVVAEGVPAPFQKGDANLNSSVGKYLFSAPNGQGSALVGFFHVQPLDDGNPPLNGDYTLDIVKLINNNPDIFRFESALAPTSMPNWLNGSTAQGATGGDGTHGCPVTPPVPVTTSCSSGRYPITLQPLTPSTLQEATGQGVTVFVLDTLPVANQVVNAAQAANLPGTNNNLLLKDIATGMVSGPPFNAVPPAININYQILPDILDTPNPEFPRTGKDIYGNLIGFPMADHGLFVAGIVHDLAPKANIECIRVLNDFGVGNTATLISALQYIQGRVAPGGDLQNTPVVVNLSLVTTPSDQELQMPIYGFDPTTIPTLRQGLYVAMKPLADRGVVFVCSAGNDSDPRAASMAMAMGMSGMRQGSRFPAAFAYASTETDPAIDSVIPVGAVDNSRQPASYSNYPGNLGIATYGGGLLPPDPPTEPAATVVGTPHAVTKVAGSEPYDALRGIYSSKLYPALWMLDEPSPSILVSANYPERDVNPRDTWAYWSGTSFATPIISAVVARFLQGRPADPSGSTGARAAVLSAAGTNTTTWDNLDPSAAPSVSQSGPLIMATQRCADANPIA